jgi:hypothetical protein
MFDDDDEYFMRSLTDDEYYEREEKREYKNSYKTILPFHEGDTGDYSKRFGKEIVALKFDTGITAINANFADNEIEKLVIPDTVTHIAPGTFMHNRLTELMLSPKIAVIGEDTFAENLLTSLTIPEGAEGIGIGAFRDNKLQSIVLPDSLRWLGDGAFARNPLTQITIGESVQGLDEDGTPCSIPFCETFGVYGVSFIDCYIKTGSAAGTYTYNEDENHWAYTVAGKPKKTGFTPKDYRDKKNS